ncbi:MAG: class I SAM-dependent methyltransferase [Gammaproteobacteria bacterium]
MTERVRLELLERLDHFSLAPKVVLDLEGKADGSQHDLRRKFSGARLLSTGRPSATEAKSRRGSFFGRLFQRGARTEYLEATLAHLPLEDRSVDLVVAHDWSAGIKQLDAALSELHRVLVPGGLFLCSTPSPTSTPGHADIHDLGSALMRAGFMEPVLDIDRIAGSTSEVIHVAAFAGAARYNAAGHPVGEGETVLPFPRVSQR